MELQYFKCEWLPLPNKKIGMLRILLEGTLTIPDRFGCYLGIGFSETWRSRDDGCYIIPFWWRTPSKEILEECLREIQVFLTFVDLHSISKEEFESGHHERWFPDLDGARDIAELANHNEMILKNTPDN